MKNKIELFNEIEILSKLDDNELKIVADYSEFQNFSEGKIIFEKGSISRCFYIVQSGEVRITSQTHTNDDEAIACFIPGEIFGEFE